MFPHLIFFQIAFLSVKIQFNCQGIETRSLTSQNTVVQLSGYGELEISLPTHSAPTGKT